MLTNSEQIAGLSDVAVFVCVVQSGSFTAAADKLKMSKSVISKYVTRLEERLGARLLNRTTRRLNLTEVGRVFYERSCEGLVAINEAEQEVAVLQGDPRGTLRVNCPMSFGILHVAPAINDFLASNPQLSVDLNLDDRKVDAIEEGFDVSVRITSTLEPGPVARRIGPCRHALVASPVYLERNGTPRTPKDLASHNVITYRYQASPWEWEFTAQGAEPISIPVTGSLQMNNSLAIREAVLAGAGISRMPTFVVGKDIQQGLLQPLLTNYAMLEVSIYLVFPQRKHLAPKIRAFVEFMASRFSGTPHWDE
ncbi:MAG: LysR family transcriptional regulator [Woeseia sp.]